MIFAPRNCRIFVVNLLLSFFNHFNGLKAIFLTESLSSVKVHKVFGMLDYVLALLLAGSLLCAGPSVAASKKAPVPAKVVRKSVIPAAALRPSIAEKTIPDKTTANKPADDKSDPVTKSASTDLLTLLKAGLEVASRGDGVKTGIIQSQLKDRAAHQLLEWALLRSDYRAPLTRLKTFLKDHKWPGDAPIRFKAEQALLQGNYGPREVIDYFGASKPEHPQGRMALALALIKLGQIADAHHLIHDTWRSMKLTEGNEKEIMKRFPGVVTRADRKFRMDRLLYDENTKEALRIAKELGGDELILAQARIAVITGAKNAPALLDAAPASVKKDPGYMFSKIQWLRRQKREREAIALLLQAPKDAKSVVNGDEWWVERRLLSRVALELGDNKAAYQLAAQHSSESPIESMEAEFHAGWIALRFMKDSQTADRHFQNLQKDAERPISVSRGAYWRARAAEAAGKKEEAKKFYQAAAKLATTFYGQLAHAKLGHSNFSLRATPKPDAQAKQQFENREDVRALRLLLAIDDAPRARMFITHLAKTMKNSQELGLLAAIADERKEARYAVLIGKEALYRDLPLDTIAFPTHGLPNISTTNNIERALAYAIARQESVFDPNVKSPAGATGLFQVLPGTAKDMAKRHGIPWQPKMINDPSYNMKLGTAYLDKLIRDLSGSYILTFAAYNAGPGRVREWIQRFGDPRDPRVDPVDWVESIPFTETRNYVMRVMENLQVYRARMARDLSAKTHIEQDMQRGRTN